MTALLVVAGALVGAPLRVWVTRTAARLGGDPAVGTLVVNVLGSGVLGMLAGAADLDAATAALLGTGFCGALTTFSTFGADVLRLADLRRLPAAIGYVMATLVLGLGAAAIGWSLTGGAW